MWKFFENLTRAFPEDDPSAPPNRLLAFYRYYLRGFEWHIGAVTVLHALQAVLEVVLFAFIGKIVDWLADKNPAHFLAGDNAPLWWMAAVLLVVLPVVGVLAALVNYQGIMGNMPMAIRWRGHSRLLQQSMAFYSSEFSGRVATKLMQTALAVRQSVMALLGVLLYVLVFFVSTLILIGDVHPLLMLPIVIWLVLYVLLQYFFIPPLKNIAQAQADARSDMTGRIVDAYTNISTVKLFAHDQREKVYAKNAMRHFLTTVHRQFRLLTVLEFFSTYLNNLLIFSMAALGIYLWSQNGITTGAIAVGLSLALRIQSMSQWVRFELAGLFENIGTALDGMQTLSKPIAVQDAPAASELAIDQGAIEFNNVHFSYRGEGEQRLAVLQNFNLKIQGGEKIGIVGHSGAGKSTLINALLRFYDIDSGAILIDGQNIAHVSQQSLRRQIGMVSQDTSLLHRTVGENIRYGNPDASDAALQKAIEDAAASEFIASLRDNDGNSGLNTLVGERGVKLSGGQRQRIAIARVLLKDAPILILDEATSALDSEVEHVIQESLWRLMSGKTVIAIAHRLSTIAAMDRLVVMDGGKVVEMGSHRALLAADGIYAKLWARQTGGYLGD